MFAVVEKDDGTGKIAIAISDIVTVEEHMGANTSSTYTVVTTSSGGPINVKNTFKEFMEIINYHSIAHFDGEPMLGPQAGRTD